MSNVEAGVGRKTVQCMGPSILLVFLCLLLLGPNCAIQAPGDIKVVTHGGAGQVSGPLSILGVDYHHWMVDCGLYYPEVGSTAEARASIVERESSRLPDGSTEVDGVFLTHAHLDHIGCLPLMVREAYDGPIYATDGTIQVAEPMLRMQIRYEGARRRSWVWSDRNREADYIKAHWNPDCEWIGRISRRNRADFEGTIGELHESINPSGSDRSVSPCEVCADHELRPLLALIRPLVPLPGMVATVESLDSSYS